MKKTITLILALTMLLTLAACGTSEDAEATPTAETVESAEPSEDVEATEEVEETATPTYDWQTIWQSHDMDEVMLTVNGSDVLWDEYFYWIYMNVTSFEQSYGTVDLSAELTTDLTYGDYLLTFAEQYAIQYHVLDVNAADEGIALTAEDEEYLSGLVADYIEAYCGTDATDEDFEAFLAEDCLTRRVFDFMNETSLLHQRMWTDLYGENGELYPDADSIAWGEDEGYTTVKHILILTQDDEGNALDDEAKAEKYAEAEELLAQLTPLAGTAAVETTFDELMNEYSEDPGLASYPDGYCYTSGTMYTEFEDAASALGDYGVSDIVETESGYHIILRLPLAVDDVLYDYGYSLRYVAAQSDFDDLITGWMEDATVTASEFCENLVLADLLVTE